MEGDERQIKKHFLDVTDIYLNIEGTYWHIHIGIYLTRHTETSVGVISVIYMQFALK